MAMPSLMAAHWVGQNSGPIFRRLWTKLYRTKFACAEVSIVCIAIFQLMFVAFQRYLQSSREVVQNRAKILMFLGRQIFLGGRDQNYDRIL